MPLIQVHLNTDGPENLEAFQGALSELLAKGVGKSEDYVMTRISSDEAISFARSTEPAAYVEVKNIGTMSPDQTASLSESICGAIATHANVPGDRVYIEFSDAQRHLWGWNGRNFA